MKHRLFLMLIASTIFFGCSKSDNSSSSSTTVTNAEIISDFVNKTAIPTYYNLDTAALALKNALNTLNSETTDANLTIAKTKWKSLRAIWEQSEGFLIGPVESEDYDPNTDTWPTDYVQMDSLLSKHATASTLLTEDEVAGLDQALRGYHPIEYIIFGDHGSRTATDLTIGQLAYMVGLAADLYDNNIHKLYLSWTSSSPYGDQLINAGNGSEDYAKVQDAIMAIANGMIDICNEVAQDGADGKINGPYIGNNGAGDPNLVESPYSGNSWTDFKNNITGAENVYLGLNGGVGLSSFVSQYSKDIDNTIKTQFTAAINSFDNLGSTYFEDAILASSGKRTLVEQTRTAIKTLQATLESKLTDQSSGLIVTYIKN